MSDNTTTTNKIAVIGPTQSGKTCLAVGLFATNTKDFTIESVDTDGWSYLADMKSGIAQGVWPDSTNKGTKRDVRFDFMKKGKSPIRVAFPEYGGEILASDETFKKFANEYLTNLSGVVLLVNPGAEAFQSNSQVLLEDVMLQYKRVFSFLRDENNGSRNAVVALTVTAADRIKGDLKGKLESFNRSLVELSNTLEVDGFRWKRFDVTVTGHLKEQDKPGLASGKGNSAATPFLWLLDVLNWLPMRQKLVRKILLATLSAGLLAALAGVWCGVDAWNAHNEISKKKAALDSAIKNCVKRLNPSDSDLEEVRTSLDALRNHKGWFQKSARDSANEFEREVWDVHEKRITNEISKIADNPETNGNNHNVNSVDILFNAFIPSTNNTADSSRNTCKQRWDKNKPGYQEKYACAQILEKIQIPLTGLSATHGTNVFDILARLYTTLDNLSPVGTNAVALKKNVSLKLDDREEMEWRDFAIPDFNQAASTNASREETRAFVKRLESWKPATTNGAAAKSKLYIFVTNTVPTWRKRFEYTSFWRRVDDAVKSGDMVNLAKLYPERVEKSGETNDYLTAAYVLSQWEKHVQRPYEKAYSNYIEKVVREIENRSRPKSCPKFDEKDKDNIDKRAREVGAPFDADATVSNVKQIISTKASKWCNDRKKECEKWVKDKVHSNRKRTGQGSLWDDYNRFIRNNKDNPFATSVVRPAVYLQAEKWLSTDIDKLRALDCQDRNYKGDVQENYDSLRKLCRTIMADSDRPKTSWASHFAEACDQNENLTSASKCFRQTLSISQIEGRVDYGSEGQDNKKDFRNTYKGTNLELQFEIERFSGETNTYNLVIPQSPLLKKENNHQWVSVLFKQLDFDISPFDVMRLKLKAIDLVGVMGRDLKCTVAEISKSCIVLDSEWEKEGVTLGGEFDLSKATKIAPKGMLTTRDPTPEAYIKISASLEGYSIDDYVCNAKNMEKEAKQRQ